MTLRLALILLVPAACWAAEPVRFVSSGSQVSLIELYTSEGCSSCPPADRWLGSLREDPGLWREFVPVAFHVTFWDDLGWTDRLAHPSFTARERAYAASWGSSSVYTPCFVRNGSEWRPSWGTRGEPARAGTLTVVGSGEDSFTITYEPPSPSRGRYAAHVALLAGGIASRVTAGENSGETLRHEFVALSLETVSLQPAGESSHRGEISLKEPSSAPASRRALAAWVTLEGEQAPLQATGGWLQGR
jgi:hypothetical protein